NQLEVLVDDKECMYVYDRGYLDYERFDRMTDNGYFFLTRLRKNAFIRVIDDLVTNRFDLSAEAISEMYKSRWAIELFFKWIKQHLNIKKCYGQSETAVYNQVFIALIVFCLNVLAKIHKKNKRKILQISRYLRAALWKPAYIWLRKIEGKGAT